MPRKRENGAQAEAYATVADSFVDKAIISPVRLICKELRPDTVRGFFLRRRAPRTSLKTGHYEEDLSRQSSSPRVVAGF